MKVLLMAALGYALVMGAEVVSSFRWPDTGALWEKLVDRMLDRDVPRLGEPADEDVRAPKVAKKKPRVTPGPAKPSQKPAGADVSAHDERAELPAPSPEDYMRETRRVEAKAARPPRVPDAPAVEAAPGQKARASEELDRRRLDEIVRRVTSEL